MLPSIMRTFFGTKKVVEFVPASSPLNVIVPIKSSSAGPEPLSDSKISSGPSVPAAVFFMCKTGLPFAVLKILKESHASN